MKKYRILLVGRGEDHEVGTFFENALVTFGCDYACLDMRKYQKDIYSTFDKICFHLLGSTLTTFLFLNQEVLRVAASFRPQIVLIIKGSHIRPATLQRLKQRCSSVLVNYATDDPFNWRVSNNNIVRCIPYYDLYACTKKAIMDDVCKAGCNNVAFIPFAYDPQSHFRELAKTTEERDRFSSDIAFIGFADPDRPPLIHALEKIPGIRISLYGGNWENFPELNKYYRGLAYGRDYRLALSGSKIILGLVRHANRDGHSMRTFEIPACKTFMLAERTDEHLELFEENQEAVYFGSIPEMVEKAIYYKNHSIERDQIASAGNLRLAKDRNAYSDRLITIFKYI